MENNRKMAKKKTMKWVDIFDKQSRRKKNSYSEREVNASVIIGRNRFDILSTQYSWR